MAAKPIRSSFAKSVKFNYDMSEFEANAKKVIEEIQHETKNMLIKASTDFADGAAKATPPSIGKASIEKKYWSRPILVLGLLIRNKYPNHKPTKEDYAQYHNNLNQSFRRRSQACTPIYGLIGLVLLQTHSLYLA